MRITLGKIVLGYIPGALFWAVLVYACLGCAGPHSRTLLAEMQIDCERAFRHIPIRLRPGLHSWERRDWLQDCVGERLNGTAGRFERAVRAQETTE